MGVGLRPVVKAPEAPPMPYRPRASPRLYTNLVGTLQAGPRALPWGSPGTTLRSRTGVERHRPPAGTPAGKASVKGIPQAAGAGVLQDEWVREQPADLKIGLASEQPGDLIIGRQLTERPKHSMIGAR